MLKMYLSRASGTALVVRWLGLHAFTVGSPGLVPGWGANVPQAEQRSQKILSQKTSCFSPSSWISRSCPSRPALCQNPLRLCTVLPASQHENVHAAEAGLSLEAPGGLLTCWVLVIPLHCGPRTP